MMVKSSATKTSQNHDETTDHKLIAADHDRVFIGAETLDQDNTCKPNDAAKDFGNGKLFLMEDDIGNYDFLSEIFAKSPAEQLLLRILHPGSIILWELCKLKNNRKEKYVLHFP